MIAALDRVDLSCRNDLAALERERHEAQLQEYLDGFSLRAARLKGIGPARLALLLSNQIATAGDVHRGLKTVDGIGPALSQTLRVWSRQLASRFRFNPSRPVDPRERARVIQGHTRKRLEIEGSIKQRLTSLETSAPTIRQTHKVLIERAAAAQATLAQAQADWAVVAA